MNAKELVKKIGARNRTSNTLETDKYYSKSGRFSI